MNYVNTMSLFYQEPTSLLVSRKIKLDFLRIYQFFMEQMLEAIYFFCDKKMLYFDSHVGETLCQVRAYKNLLMVDKYFNDEGRAKIKKEIVKIKNIIEIIKSKISSYEALINEEGKKYNRNLDAQITQEEFITNNSILFNIEVDIFYLFQSKVLCTFANKDEYNIPLSINYEKLSSILKCGKTSAKNIIKNFQSKISKISCDFINMLSNDILTYDGKSILLLLNIKDNQKRYVLPCYEATKILLSHIIKTKKRILFLIYRKKGKKTLDTLSFLFRPSNIENEFKFEIIKNADKNFFNRFCMVFMGNVTYFEGDYIESKEEYLFRFLNVGAKNIILANMAKHPQYSADELKPINNEKHTAWFSVNECFSLKENPYKYLLKSKTSRVEKVNEILSTREKEIINMKIFSEERGCCIESQRLFLINHIYCDTLEKYLESDQLNNYLFYQKTIKKMNIKLQPKLTIKSYCKEC